MTGLLKMSDRLTERGRKGDALYSLDAIRIAVAVALFPKCFKVHPVHPTTAGCRDDEAGRARLCFGLAGLTPLAFAPCARDNRADDQMPVEGRWVDIRPPGTMNASRATLPLCQKRPERRAYRPPVSE